MHKLKEFRTNLELLLMDAFTKDSAINRVVIERFLRGDSVSNIHAETNSSNFYEHTVKQIEQFQNKVYEFVSSDNTHVEVDSESEITENDIFTAISKADTETLKRYCKQLNECIQECDKTLTEKKRIYDVFVLLKQQELELAKATSKCIADMANTLYDKAVLLKYVRTALEVFNDN